MKPFVFDVDGVLLDWHKGFISYAESKGYVLNTEHPHDTYDMSVWFHDMSVEQFKQLIKEFNSGKVGVELEPMPCAVEAMKAMRKSFPDTKFIVLTAYGVCEELQQARLNQIETFFPGIFDEVQIIGLGDCKKAHLEEIDPSVYVEDSVQHTTSAHSLGIPYVYLINHTYNLEDNLSIRVDTMSDVLDNALKLNKSGEL